MSSNLEALANAANLNDLLAAMNDVPQSDDVENILTDLPTFGGDEPASTHGVFSWDATRLLVQVGDSRRFAIVDRDDS